jgi:signal transduction histidine kinase
MRSVFPFLMGGGEMGELTRNFDWGRTPVGNPDTWPMSLRTTVSNILRSRFPMFLWWGPDMIQFYNDAYRPSMGNEGKHPKALGQKGKDCWPEIWPIISPLHQEVIATGEPTWREDQLVPIYRNGKIEDVYWTYSYSSVLDDDGNHGGILVTCSETTEKVMNLRQLEEHKNQLHFAIEATELGTWEYNPLTNKLSGNERIKELFGIPADGELDLTIAINVIVAEDRERVSAAILDALDPTKGGRYNIEYTVVHPRTGEHRMVKAKGRSWFNEMNIAYRFNGTLQDITQEALIKKELAEKKQSLELAIEISELGVFEVDLLTNTATYSQQVINWFGLERQHMGMEDIFSRIYYEDRDRIAEAIRESTIAFDKGKHDLTYRVQNEISGKILYLRSIGKVQRKEGKPVAISGIIEDVTTQVLARMEVEEIVEIRTKELARSNDLLLKSNAELVRTNKSLEEFAFAASHDLKEPIRKIQYFSGRLKELLDTRITKEEEKYFERMESASKRMSALIDDLLSYSQVSVPPSRFEEVDVTQLINLVLSELGNEIQEKKAKISVDRMCKIRGHQKQLHQLFQNLIRNALKYSREGVAPEISVSCTPVKGQDTGWQLNEEDQEKNYYLIEVRDNGIGFNQNEADRIFNVFTRLHGNAEYKGTGVGLSIVRKVVENHKAYVTAKGELQKGASFLILFPVEIPSTAGIS